MNSPARSKLDDQSPSLDDYSAQAIEILAARPPWLARGLIVLLTALLISGFAWSFVGRADVIVTASGHLGPEAEERLVYTPVTGRLLDLYIAEGTAVAEGDILARLDAPGAIQLVSSSMEAQLKLQQARAAVDLFPIRQKSMQQEIELLEFQIDAADKEHALREAEGMEKLAEEQKLKLEKARLNLSKAQQAMDFAQREFEAHQRLFNSEGGGGISRTKLEEKQKEHQTKINEFEVARAELAEFEVKLNSEFAKKQRELRQKSETALRYHVQLDQKKVELANAQLQVEVELRQAKMAAEVAEQIKIGDVDEDSMLRIRAPAAGVITRISNTQAGAKIEQKTPLVGMAPADALPVLHVEIREQDRAFLQEGMSVKLKFNAFPYQRYGFIEGTLEYIAPSAVPSTSKPQSKAPIYKGRVSLARHYFKVPGKDNEVPVRYGMTAQAEIVVQQRRLIDLALDPLRRNAS